MHKAKLHWISYGLWACMLSCNMNSQTFSACLTRDLTIDSGDTSGAMHTNIYSFVITNHGNRTCDLSGYPSAAALNGERKIVREIVFQHSDSVGGVVYQKIAKASLPPGGRAWFEVMSNDATGLDDTSFCKKATMVRITPPLNHQPFQKLFPFNACSPSATISFLLAGTPE